MAADAWFYTVAGERIGPVTFSDLQIKATEGTLNPRLDMAWTQGMAEWKPTGEIEGLFERKNNPEEELQERPGEQRAAGTPGDPYTPPGEDAVTQRMLLEAEWPGVRRRGYFFALFILPILWYVILAWSTVMLKEQFGSQLVGWIILVAVFVPFIIWIAVTVKRFINIGMTGWWFAGLFVPLLNIWLHYRLFACPAGYAYHRKMDGIGIFLAIIYWLSFVISILGTVAVILAMAGAAGSPELQDKLREIIRLVVEKSQEAR